MHQQQKKKKKNRKLLQILVKHNDSSKIDIKMPESQNIEYKSNWHDDYLKWVCGFANAQGGKIYIGMNDAATVVGVED